MSTPGRLSKIRRSQLEQIHRLERKYGDCMETMHQVMAAYGDFKNASDELRFAAAVRISEYKYRKRAAQNEVDIPPMVQISFLDADTPSPPPRALIESEAVRVQ